MYPHKWTWVCLNLKKMLLPVDLSEAELLREEEASLTACGAVCYVNSARSCLVFESLSCTASTQQCAASQHDDGESVFPQKKGRTHMHVVVWNQSAHTNSQKATEAAGQQVGRFMERQRDGLCCQTMRSDTEGSDSREDAEQPAWTGNCQTHMSPLLPTGGTACSCSLYTNMVPHWTLYFKNICILNPALAVYGTCLTPVMSKV